MSVQSHKVDGVWLARQIGSPSIYNITHKIAALIEQGKITTGALLPPIRTLAKELNIGPTTVATAFTELKSRNIIRSKQGIGSVVIDNPVTAFPQRLTLICSQPNTQGLLNLNGTHPDSSLLPSLEPALLYAAKNMHLDDLECQPIVTELQTALSANWPYPAKSFMAVNNSFEVITHLLTLFVSANAYIAIENPTSINELDKLRRENIRFIGVERDREGPIIRSLASALAKKPALFIYQPREHLATGTTVSKTRMMEMAALFKTHSTKTLIIENDIIGDLSTFPAYSIGEFLPEQTVYIRSYHKVYSLELCVRVASGPETIIQQLYHYRLYNLGWNSRLLPLTLAYLLRDKNTALKVRQAQMVYTQRYSALLEALKARHIYLPNDQGAHLFLWLSVGSEQQTLSRLAEKGIIACGGSNFMLTPSSQGKEYIRIMTSQLSTPALIDRVADAIAFALSI